MSDPRYRSLERRYRWAWRWGLLLSLVVHALLFVVFDAVPLPPSPFSAAGPNREDSRAAPGSGMQAVELQSPQSNPPQAEPVPEAREEALEPEPEPEPEMELPTVALMEGLLAPGRRGPLDVPGLPDGVGAGAGGTEREGRFRVAPPRPRGLILPPGDRPDDVSGKEVEVWVYVSAAGRVVADSTRLNPPTGDRGFDRRLREHAAGWVFEAARRDGRPVAEWFRYTIVM
ncbi:MAG: hypothetical protein ACLFRX_10670 [Gemmatimonadota bacterium]